MKVQTPTHRDSNVEACMERLAELFPGIAEESDHVIQLWRDEFGGRPATACQTALDAMKRAATSQYPQLASFIAICERASGGAIRAQIDQQRQDRLRQMDEHRKIAERAEMSRSEFRRQFAAYSAEDQETLLKQALDWFGDTGRLRFKGLTVHDSAGLCAIVQAYHDKLFREAQR